MNQLSVRTTFGTECCVSDNRQSVSMLILLVLINITSDFSGQISDCWRGNVFQFLTQWNFQRQDLQVF